MGRVVIAEASLEDYLQKLTKLPGISIGLIIGQPNIQGKDYVVHLARTPKDEVTEDTEISKSPTDLGDYLVSNHALSVIRMLPAGMYIIGIFIVCPTNLFDDSISKSRLLSWIAEINSIFTTYGLLHGSSNKIENGEMLVLHYSSLTKSLICKSFENSSSNTRSKSVDWKFQEKLANWILVETFYELNEIFPIIRRDDKFQMEENFGSSLDAISDQISKSIIFLDGEILDNDELLESTLKEKKGAGDNKKVIQAALYYPCNEIASEWKTKIVKYDGSVHYLGVIGTKIWVHPKNSIYEVKEFIKTDIIRSLAARIQIHCDALIENDHIENHIVINEPPRRIFYPIKSGQIQFSDYIFRGEGDDTIIRQAKDILDLDLQKIDIISDVEVLPTVNDESISTTGKSIKTNPTTKNNNKLILICGFAVAVFIVLLSILLHFYLKE